MLFENVLYAAAALVVLTNPLAELPVFLGVVAGRPRRDMGRAAAEVALGVWLVLVLSALGGLRLLDLVGIDLPAFRAAGGLLLIVMGMEMILGRESSLQRVDRSAGDPEDALWVPLVMPMLAGPGAIVTTVSLTIRDTLVLGWFPVATLIAVTLAAALVFVTLSSSVVIVSHLPRRTELILKAFSGLILVAIGFQMGFTGTAEFFRM